jgi:hypothetical protein
MYMPFSGPAAIDVAYDETTPKDRFSRIIIPEATTTGGGEIIDLSNITATQVIGDILGIPAFLPLTICTGYLVGWWTDLHGFRERSIVERIFWSLPLSLSVSTIASVLIGKFISLIAVTTFFWVSSLLCVATLGLEWLERRRHGRRWSIGFQPLGTIALIFALAWVAGALLSLVDFQWDERLYMSMPFYDHGIRVNWSESVLRTGIPPDNPLYLYQHAAHLRYYYFWLVNCAVVTRLWHLPPLAVMTASCIWAGFCLAAVIGLFLKHFLKVGVRLRTEFLVSISLLFVGGLSGLVIFLKIGFLHQPFRINVWSPIQIPDWWSILMFYPHHVAGLVCVMFAFLLAWMAGNEGQGTRVKSLLLIAAALASAFGLSVYVAFAFFLVALMWFIWQVAFEREWRSPALLAFGGAGALVLLIPYLLELTTSTSKMLGGSLFSLAVRPTIPSGRLLTLPAFSHFATGHPVAAEIIARTILLVPAYIIELGFFLVILAIYLVPRLRGKQELTSAQRSLVVIAVATFPVTSFIRSGVLEVNDFGLHSAMFLQFPLLLLATEVVMGWRFESRKVADPQQLQGLPRLTPGWIKSLATLAMVFGILTTGYRALALRFLLPIGEAGAKGPDQANVAQLSHKAYFSRLGYAHLDSSIPHNAIVQFNAADPWTYWKNVDLVNIHHQVAIAEGSLWCGAELGGDPTGCPQMASAINALYSDATADEARSTCRLYGIEYLIANVYDPVWNNKESWVWKLNAVVADPEFRALDCGERN